MKYFYFLLFFLLSSSLFAQNIWTGDPLFITSSQPFRLNVRDYVGILADSTKSKTIEQIQQIPDNQFISLQDTYQNLTYNLPYWIKIHLQNKTDLEDTWAFQTWATETEFYLHKPDSGWRRHKAGYWRKIEEVEGNIYNRTYMVFHLKPQEKATVYVRATSQDHFPPLQNTNLLYFRDYNNDLKTRLSENNLQQGIFQGMLWIMIIYNLLVFLSVRDKSYLYYALYLVGAASYFAFRFSLFNQYLPYPKLNSYIWLFSIVSTSIFYYIFTRSFFNTAQHFPKLDRLIRLWIVCKLLITSILFSVIFISDNTRILVDFGALLVPLEGIIGLYVLYVLGKYGGKLASFFVIGNLSLLLTALFYVIRFNLAFYNIITRNDQHDLLLLEFGIVVEMIFFSLGLGQRMEINEREKRKAQEGLIVQLRENELLMDKVNRELEQKVQERTLQLAEKNEEIVRQNEEIGLQKSLIEKKNHNITASITYAKRIQEAMLPKHEQIREHLSDFFVFFRPRDIVSGDFYFVEQIDQTVVVAVADCTGHGVPGAFMSLIGNDLLNEIVSLSHIIEPDQILNHLHRRIRQALKQAQNEVRDGMDIAVLAIDLQEKEMQFAGAKNPLVLIRNGELEHFKGSRMPIGGFQKEETRIFDKQIIKLNPAVPVMCYLFTDGFQDQFGGEHGLKFMLKNFKNLLLDIHTLPLPDQEKVLQQQLDAWRKGRNTDQTDDILVFGIRLNF